MAVIFRSKKAMFFTLISVVLVLAIIVFFMPNYDSYTYMSKIPTLKTRFVKANSFAGAVYGSTGERLLYYSSYNAIRSLENYINQTKKPINLTRDFYSAIMYGTIGGVDQPLMNNNTITEKIAVLQRLSREELNLDCNISINNVTIYQSELTGHDQIAIGLNISFQLDAGMARWDSDDIVTVLIKVDKFDDPLYLMNTNAQSRISFSNLSNWTTVQEVYLHIDQNKYAHDPMAPTFLMRLENISDNSTCCGIESLINPVELGLNTEVAKNYVDYCFFLRPKRASCGWDTESNSWSYLLGNFTGISQPTQGEKFYGFRLVAYHMSKYNITSAIDDTIPQMP